MGMLKIIAIRSVVWTFIYVFWAILRQFGQELVDAPNLNLAEGFLIYTSLGIITATIFVTTDHLLNKKLSTNISFGAAILVRSFLYLGIFLIVLIIGTVLFVLTDNVEFEWGITFNYLFSKEGALLLVYFFFNLLLIQFIIQIDKKFGPGNLLRMFGGKFYKPREVERIVMFLDLKASTTIAEQIGNIQFSQLIQDCFDELNIVRKYKAEIYQYVGDEAVIIWNVEDGIEQANCLSFYFAFSERLSNRAAYYQNKYGLVPEFKCGSHIGKVIMTEIGQIKREIAYHGDVMNTASRIQDQCNVTNNRYLLSEDLYHHLAEYDLFRFELLDSIPLKGKSQEVRIYGVEEKVKSESGE